MIRLRASSSKECSVAAGPAVLLVTLHAQVSRAGRLRESATWLSIARGALLAVLRMHFSGMVPRAQRARHIATMDHVPLGSPNARHCMVQVSVKLLSHLILYAYDLFTCCSK